MILGNRFRIKSFTLFVIFMVFVSAIYLFIAIPPQKRFRDFQMSNRLEQQKSYVTQKIKNSNQIYREKIRYFISNQSIVSAFANGNKVLLKREVQPFMAVLEMENPYYFVINFFRHDNTPFLLMQGMTEVEKPETGFSYIEKTNELQQSHFGYEICGKDLFYKIVRPLFFDNRYIGCIEFGIRDIEVIEQLKKNFGIIPAAYFCKIEFAELIKDTLAWDSSTRGAQFTYYAEDDLLDKALITNPEMEAKLVAFENRDFLFSNFGEFRDYADNLLGGLYAGTEVTDIQKSYKSFLKYQLIGILVILVIVFAVFYFFFGYFFEKIYQLKRTLDERIAERSREIIDTNNELNLIFNTTSNAMRLIDKDYNILKVNHAFTVISGYSVSEAEGKKCYNLFSGDKCHTEQCSLNKLLKGEDKVEFQSVNLNKNGIPVPVIQTSVPLKGNDGNIYGIIEDLRDLTELVKTEDALKKSEKEFSMFMDDLPLGVFVKDEDSRALYLNNYMDKIFGKSNCLDKKPGEIFPAYIAKRVLKEDIRVLSGENIVVEEALQDKQGNERFYMTHKFLLKNENQGKRIGGISIDITRKKEAEKQLNLLSRAVQFTPVCVVITNYEGEIEYVNHAFQSLTGYTFEEVAGKNIGILGSDLHDEDFFTEMWNFVKGGKDWQGEIQNRRKNGEIYWERLSISPVKDSEGEIRHFIAVKEDNTRQKEFEQKLNESKEKAIESDRLKTAFLTNFSHEIRTPMNAIVGLSELLINSKVPLSEKKGFTNTIQENSKILLSLIDDIIDISKIDAGLVELKESNCKLNQLLEGLYEEFQKNIQQTDKLYLRLVLKKAISQSDFLIVTDESRLKQVLSNLLGNAIKFTDSGRVEFGYVIKDENNILFFVKDSGLGISESKLDTVFERFQSVDDTLTRNHRGTGLGLAISKSIIELMSGKIWVRSIPNQGSTFFFTLPFKTPAIDAELIAGLSKLSAIHELEGKTILVADEINANFLLIEAGFKKTNASVLWARHGKDAVDIVRKNKNIDLIIMDVELPVISGFEALVEIKRLNNDLPVIMQSTFSLPGHIEKCIQAGCDGYILKPVNMKQLLEKSADCLRNN